MSVSHPAHDYSYARRSTPLAPILVGTAIALVMLAAHTKLGAWLRGFLAAPHVKPARDALARRIEAGWSLAALRGSIVGRRKASIVAAYGPPRTARSVADYRATMGRTTTFWSADTWYYPVDPRTRTAMAVEFVENVARDVEFFDAPWGA